MRELQKSWGTPESINKVIINIGLVLVRVVPQTTMTVMVRSIGFKICM